MRLFTKEGIVMKLKQKQRLERNKITFILGLIILGLLNALTLLGFVDATADKSVVLARMVVNVILLVIFFVGHVRYRGDRKFVMISLSCMFLTYAVMILSNKNVVFYAFMYLIMLTVMLYRDIRLARISAIAMGALNVISGILHFVKYPGTRSESVSQIVLHFFRCCDVYAVDLQARHHVEDTDASSRRWMRRRVWRMRSFRCRERCPRSSIVRERKRMC